MKEEMFTVVHPNLKQTQMSIREADLENDIFRIAFDEACKNDKPQTPAEELFAWDFFKYGWEAAVRLLNDDPVIPDCEFKAGDWVKVIREEPFHWATIGSLHQVSSVRFDYQDVVVWGGNCIDWDQIELTPTPVEVQKA